MQKAGRKMGMVQISEGVANSIRKAVLIFHEAPTRFSEDKLQIALQRFTRRCPPPGPIRFVIALLPVLTAAANTVSLVSQLSKSCTVEEVIVVSY